jgi:CRISPR/Cas system-associated exonuclease Cas4 (RecB family)
MWFLSYIQYEEREQGFFSDFGNIVHKTIELFFKGELEIWDLSQYYEDNYSKYVISNPPPYPPNMGEKYYAEGLEFFTNFQFNLEDYEVIFIEDKFKTTYNEIKLVIKPDLILKDKKTGKYILFDYKTHKLKGNKTDEEYLSGYKKQLYLYSYFLKIEKNIDIDKIILWFIRNNENIEIEVNPTEIRKALVWMEETVVKIKAETEFEPNLSKKNGYFCSFICSMKSLCRYRNEEL